MPEILMLSDGGPRAAALWNAAAGGRLRRYRSLRCYLIACVAASCVCPPGYPV
jgi:hypothetical protein